MLIRLVVHAVRNQGHRASHRAISIMAGNADVALQPAKKAKTAYVHSKEV
jgi:hypothetical protein